MRPEIRQSARSSIYIARLTPSGTEEAIKVIVSAAFSRNGTGITQVIKGIMNSVMYRGILANLKTLLMDC